MSKTKKSKSHLERMAKHNGMTLEEYHLHRIENRLERNRLWGERAAVGLKMFHVNDIVEHAEDILTAAEALQDAYFSEQNKIVLGSYLTTLYKTIEAIREDISEIEDESDTMQLKQIMEESV